MADTTETASRREILAAIALYSSCSSMMLVANKVAVFYIPIASLVTVIQLAFASVFVLGLKYGTSIKVGEFSMDKVRPYSIYVLAFAGSIYANMRALASSNVETIIVFRSCSPLIVAVLDSMFLGRQLPGSRSLMALLVILCGAAMYVTTDRAFLLDGFGAYGWVSTYLLLICFEMTYGKRLVSGLNMASVWESVMYTNVLGMAPTLFLGAVVGDYSNGTVVVWDLPSVAWLLVSCCIGVGISFSGWNCRSKLSATSFTVVGVLNKLATVLISTLLWDEHASFAGILSLVACVLGGSIYRQAPLRPEHARPVQITDLGAGKAGELRMSRGASISGMGGGGAGGGGGSSNGLSRKGSASNSSSRSSASALLASRGGERDREDTRLLAQRLDALEETDV